MLANACLLKDFGFGISDKNENCFEVKINKLPGRMLTSN